VEDGDADTVGGQGVPVGVRESADKAVEAQSPEVVGHLAGGVGARGRCQWTMAHRRADIRETARLVVERATLITGSMLFTFKPRDMEWRE
jgi:hypothetical protein